MGLKSQVFRRDSRKSQGRDWGQFSKPNSWDYRSGDTWGASGRSRFYARPSWSRWAGCNPAGWSPAWRAASPTASGLARTRRAWACPRLASDWMDHGGGKKNIERHENVLCSWPVLTFILWTMSLLFTYLCKHFQQRFQLVHLINTGLAQVLFEIKIEQFTCHILFSFSWN